jgi:hypothetical protein
MVRATNPNVAWVNNVTVENCTINNTQTSLSMGEGATFSGCKDISFHHNTITHCPKIMLAIANNTKNMKVFKNTFVTTVGTGVKIDGSQDATVGAYNENISIYNNLFYGTARAISIETEFKGGNKNIIVYNNVINIYNHTTSVVAIKLGQVLPYKQFSSNIMIKYNTINVWHGAGSPLQIEIFRTNWSNINITNNIFQSNDTASWQVRSSRANSTDPCFHFSNNIYDHTTKPANTAWLDGTNKFETTAILSSPQFVDRKAGNFHLNSTSPAIDAADSTYTVSTDYDDYPRPQNRNYDIGAYEYYSAIQPEITNVMITPDPQQIGGYLNISCNITDTWGSVDEVRVNITYPDHTTKNFSMNPSYYLNQTYSQIGNYQFFIWMNDTNRNSDISEGHSFQIIPVLSRAFLVGLIIDVYDSNGSIISIKPKIILYIGFNPFSFNVLSSNEKIFVSSKSYIGYIGTQFIIGVFNAAVVSEKSSHDPLHHQILNRRK